MNQFDKDKSSNKVTFIIYFIAVIFIFLFSIHVINIYDSYFIDGVLPKDKDILTAVLEAFKSIENNGFFSIFKLHNSRHLITGLFYVTIAIAILTINLFFNKRKTLYGKEQGDARFANKSEKKLLMDKANPENNIILADDVFLSMNTRKTRRNLNVLFTGGSGSGKTRFGGKPNILQANCSFVITDPKGELLKSCGSVLEKLGYIVKSFNLIEMIHSDCYNPFIYIHKQSDVLKLINQLIRNTNPPEMKGSTDPFWEKSETALLQAIFFFLWLCCPKEQQNFETVMNLIDVADASEEDESALSDLDILFQNLEEEYGSDFIAVKQYHIFKKASGKTAKSILISVGVRLSVFNIDAIKNITLTDSLQLNKMGDKKTVLFIVIPDSDTTFNFLVSMLYSQLFDELYFQADFGELQWQENKIVYRSFESIAKKKNKLQKACNTLWNSAGNKKRKETYHKILSLLNEINHECGMPVPKITKINDINQAMLKKYVHNLSPYLVRLKDRIHTLKLYIYELTKELTAVSLLDSSSGDVSKDKHIKKIFKIEKQLFYEFGLKKQIKSSFFKSNNKSFDTTPYYNLLSEMKTLLNSMEVGKLFGTRESFEDKCSTIENLENDIKRYKSEIKEASFYQIQVKKELLGKIKDCKNMIRKIEYAAEFEFGIKNLNSRRKNGGRLPVHVRCILDEFANISPIPDFQKLVATMRSREISVTIFIQNLSQLKEMYKDSWESITGNCDTFAFLGGQEQSTLEYVSKKIGNQTIDKRSTGNSKGRNGSHSVNWDVLKRELMTADEIGRMDDSKCIVFIRGMRPCFSNKYKLERHKRYPLMGETDNPSDPRLFDYKSKFNTLEIIKKQRKKVDIFGKEMKIILDECKEIAIKKINSTFLNTLGKTLVLDDFRTGNVTIADDSILLGSPYDRYKTFQQSIGLCKKAYIPREINFNDRSLSISDVITLLQVEDSLPDVIISDSIAVPTKPTNNKQEPAMQISENVPYTSLSSLGAVKTVRGEQSSTDNIQAAEEDGRGNTEDIEQNHDIADEFSDSDLSDLLSEANVTY